jgi:hypothetical protein
MSILSLPHNKMYLQRSGKTPAQAAASKLAEIRSGLSGVPKVEDLSGPRVFLRAVGAANRAYGGEWWFDASVLDDLEHAYSRVYFSSADRAAVVRDKLREVLAVSKEWNDMTEIWALELPPGEHLTGYSAPGTPQKLLASLPVTANGNRMLIGKVRQYYFPVKNPLWVKVYRHLA